MRCATLHWSRHTHQFSSAPLLCFIRLLSLPSDHEQYAPQLAVTPAASFTPNSIVYASPPPPSSLNSTQFSAPSATNTLKPPAAPSPRPRSASVEANTHSNNLTQPAVSPRTYAQAAHAAAHDIPKGDDGVARGRAGSAAARLPPFSASDGVTRKQVDLQWVLRELMESTGVALRPSSARYHFGVCVSVCRSSVCLWSR